jgi:3-dehydroquinate synthase
MADGMQLKKYIRLNTKINSFSYPILIGRNILRTLPKEISKFTKSKKVLILCDKIFKNKTLKIITSSMKRKYDMDVQLITPGKKSKNINNAIRILSFLEKNRYSKDSTLIALGGGTIGDLGGFVASVYYRGMNLVLIPSTLTAQIDSSYGGKVAVNFNNNVNAIGNYFHPKLVICDYGFIQSLPTREFNAGMSEVVKSALISSKSDCNFLLKNFKKIKKRNLLIISKMISRIIKIKLKIVKKDVRENNVRMFLNYGHTIGQSIEASTNLNLEVYRHGEAVSLGMTVAAKLSSLVFFKKNNIFDYHLRILKIFDLPTKISKKINKTNLKYKIFKNLFKDKKVNFQGVRFVLLKEIGNPQIVSKINENKIKSSINYILS